MNNIIEVPVLPLRDVVVFPQMVITLFVGREKSINALDEAMRNNKQVLLVTQHDATDEEPDQDTIYSIGCLGTILRMLRLPDGNIRVLVEGSSRAKIQQVVAKDDYFVANVEELNEKYEINREIELMAEQAMAQFEKYVDLNSKLPSELLKTLPSQDNIEELINSLAAHAQFSVENKQALLEKLDLAARIDFLTQLLDKEIELLEVEQKIRGRVKKQMEKSQREYYLNEQMKAIHKELDELDEVPDESQDLENRLVEAAMPKEAHDKTLAEIKKAQIDVTYVFRSFCC